MGLFQFALRRPWFCTSILLLLSLVFAWALPRISVDSSPASWLPSELEGLAEYERFGDFFGDDTLIFVIFEETAFELDDYRASWNLFLQEVGAFPEIESVVAPFQDEEGSGVGSGGLGFDPLRRILLHEEKGIAGAALSVSGEIADEDRGALIRKLEEFLGVQEELGPIRLAGSDVITQDLDEGSKSTLGKLSPLVFATMAFFLWMATRQWRIVLCGFVIVGCVGLWSIGLLVHAGQSLNLVVAVIPAILAIISIAQMMHLVSRFQCLPIEEGDVAAQKSSLSVRREWWGQAIAETWQPCLLSVLTTVAGFLALAFSEIPPTRNLGLFSAFGVLMAFVLIFFWMPTMLALSSRVHPRPHTSLFWTRRVAEGFNFRLRQQKVWIVLMALIFAALSVMGLLKIKPESYVLSFFPEEHRVPMNFHFTEQNLTGLTPFEVVIEGSGEEVLRSETLESLRAVVNEVHEKEPLLSNVVSPFLVSKERGGELHLVENVELLLGSLREHSEVPEELRAYLWNDGERVLLRTTLLTTTGSSDACHAFVNRVEPLLDEKFSRALQTRVTGAATLLVHGQVLLLETQIQSFLLALVVVTLIIACTFRSLKQVFASLLANVLPILFTLGVMGWAEIPLNTATVTVAGIALGLVVDDTIHLLHHYGALRRKGCERIVSMSDTLYFVGKPVFITSLSVALGFVFFAFSPFRPTLFFGLLIALTAMAAMICDLLVLPVVMQWNSKELER